MADISTLGVKPVEPVDLNDYPDTKGFELPKKGIYQMQAPPSFPEEAFTATPEGDLIAQVDPKIVGPTNEGFTVKYTKVSNKEYERSGRKASRLGDYLRACGLKQRLQDPQAQADAVEQTANTVYTVQGDWSAYNSRTKRRIKGMENFTSDGKGGYLPWVADPEEKDAEGNPVRLRANFVITRFIPADSQ